jgi:hypothetical protein
MQAPSIRHSHPDGTSHTHVTVVAPAISALLQQLEDFVAALQPEESVALLRLVKSGLLAEDGGASREPGGRDPYGHAWYRAYVATHHEHPGGATPIGDGDVFPYLPAWWPVRTARPGAATRERARAAQ